MSYDYLILGSGISGLYAALLASRHGRTAVVTKGPIDESNTKYAQGGIAAAVGPGDSVADHLADTLTAGAGLCDRAAVEVLVREAPDRIRRLTNLGVPFDSEHGEVALGREGAHSRPRILHAGGDRTGDAIETVMVRRVREVGVDVFDRHTVTELLVQDGRVCGVEALNPSGGRMSLHGARTILATGGAGQLYTLTTNPAVATGDGIALAWRAGAVVRDMEFVQFHPTALRLPGAPTFLLTEALRGEGAVLRDASGRRFMPEYHPQAELAPRDIVARAIATEMQRGESDHVLLDISDANAGFVAARFPGVYAHCLQYELDITREPVPVAPAAHYIMGGVYSDYWGRTTLPGLYACGEVACAGVHGANRLASNSLLETVVFAQRAVEASQEGDMAADPPADTIPLALPAATAAVGQRTLQELLWRNAGIVREGEGLRAAAAVIDSWEAPASGIEGATLANMSLVGRLLVEAAGRRKESRGAHYRSDFPEAAPDWQRHLSFVAAG
jgi:L-aspartate oxidase